MPATFLETMPSAPASVREHGRAILGDVFVEQDSSFGIAQQARQCSLAIEEWAITQILAIVLDQIEGAEHRAMRSLSSLSRHGSLKHSHDRGNSTNLRRVYLRPAEGTRNPAAAKARFRLDVKEATRAVSDLASIKFAVEKIAGDCRTSAKELFEPLCKEDRTWMLRHPPTKIPFLS